MNIPLQWSTSAIIDGVEIRIPEPEAFALHKLIVMGLRDDREKATKDLEAAQGLFLFFEDRPERVARLKEIYASFPKGWRKKVDAGLKKAKIGVEIA